MEQHFAVFLKKLSQYSKHDQDLIMKALDWAEKLHNNQKRASGEPYLVHPIGVASILIDLQLDTDSVIAALLHDSLEDTSATRKDIESRYGSDVASIVESVTKIADISAKNKTNQEAENIRKMLFAMVKDIRVILIKLADKLHNMRTLEFLSPERIKQNAQECLDIYAPLADRLGISWLKDELEDLSLKHLQKDVYYQIKDIVSLKKGERTEFLTTVQNAIYREAAASGIRITVNSRAKHFYSIYQKMRKRNKGIDELYDLFGIRILCDNMEECYTLLGTVHRLWKPIDGRFKDYIAMPKSNGYQSLHTTVMSYGGRLLEIQIRTWEMHRIAEYGIASHWLYKVGSNTEVVKPQDLPIVNRLKDWNASNSDNLSSAAFLDNIKRELLKDSIYVFTPQGKVIELPSGSTPIDFAYHIHSAIGDHCMGAKADGVIIPLTAELQNTQVVEILTAQNAHPHVNWLRAARTSKARNKIRTWLQQNDDTLIIEKNIVAKKKNNTQAAHQAGAQSQEQAATHETETLQTVVKGTLHDKNVLQVKVEDEKNMMIRFAQCCNPIPGDPIIGYVSRGRGIIVHRKNCRNVSHIPDFAERKIEVEWENTSSQIVKRFRVEARRSSDLFSEIEGAVRKHQGHLIEGRLDPGDMNTLIGFFTIEIENKEDLKKILKNLKSLPSILHIQPIQ